MNGKKHIRFDWAVKKILRDKKNFDILEGFLSELLKEDIKIEGLLESESNQEEEGDKFNRVDLYAENSKGEHIIIEIQNTRELDYLMRMLFGASKAVTEYLEVGKPYADIKKVIAVSIIYFGLGRGSDYVYVGQTKFTGLHSHKELQLTKAQQELLKQPTIHEAFPEYYLIQTTRFKDVIKEPLDEWIYFFKNSEILDSFKAKGMKEVREKMVIHNLPDVDRKKYNRFLDNLHSEASIALTMKIEEEERTAKRIAEVEKKNAIILAETEKKVAELEKVAAEAEKTIAEAEKVAAEAEKATVEAGKVAAEAEKATVEAKKATAEAEKATAEAKKKAADAEIRKTNEIVLQLIHLNLLNEQISKATGLADDEIEALRKHIAKQ
jgi:predicted transposase/invertase (TIGR01784 family)